MAKTQKEIDLLLGTAVEKAINEFYFMRMNDIGITAINTNPEYRKLNSEFKRAYEELKGQLPQEQQRLLLDLDTLYGDKGGIEGEIFYRSGFKDALRLALGLLLPGEEGGY